MVIPATSRKGKKAWRKNILDHKVRAAYGQQVADERRGGAVEGWEDERLFVVDKQPASRNLGLSKKQKARNQVLSYQKLILKNPEIQPISKPIEKRNKTQTKLIAPLKKKKKKKKVEITKKQAKQPKIKTVSKSGFYDLWDKVNEQKKLAQNENEGVDIWDPNLLQDQAPKPKHKPQKIKLMVPVLEGLQNPGQSYNPEQNERLQMLDSIYEDENEQWPDFGCEGIKVQRAHQPTSQCQGKNQVMQNQKINPFTLKIEHGTAVRSTQVCADE
eukprot:TRINITY_DN2830_c0_g1_i6.p1 TRINITY_DN2830_c0_g1~~TRINITY_DN2830_c0_g1_i6.p1  ORF type:complete len:303 (-),score=61.23 TRINITY_DN2830_c0_g1_i6:535-1350(-)